MKFLAPVAAMFLAICGGALLAGCGAVNPLDNVVIAPPDRPAATTLPDLATPVDWSAFDAVLRQDVTDGGRVDYFDIAYAGPTPTQPDASDEVRRQSLHGLRDIYALLARTGPISQPRTYPTRADKLAYYLNAYNLLAIVAIAPHFGPNKIDPAGVDDLPAPLETGLVFTLDGQQATLDTIRRQRIVPLLDGDPRALLALCAGRRNDPPLRREIYSAGKLEEQLGDQLVRVLRQPPWCHINFVDKRIELPAGIADYREYYWTGYLRGPQARNFAIGDPAQPGRVRDQVEFPTVLLHFADDRGRRWINRALSYEVVRAPPRNAFNNQPLFP